MSRRKIEPMSEGKKNIIAALLQEYDIRYCQEFFANLFLPLGFMDQPV